MLICEGPDFLLIDDLSRHGIDHLLCPVCREVGHGRLLSDQAGPSHTVLLTVPSLVVTSTVDLTAAYERLGFTTEQAQLAATQAAGSMVSTIITAVIAIRTAFSGLANQAIAAS